MQPNPETEKEKQKQKETQSQPQPQAQGQAMSQAAEGSCPIMSSLVGIPVGNLSEGLQCKGHVLASDVWMMEKQQSFNRAKIQERMVHPCGFGVFGHFECTGEGLDKLCKAEFLDTVGKKTPVFVRFSTVTYGREFPDSARNPRGMAMKFYTKEGNFDLLGLSFPVFFIRDPSQGPDVIQSQRRDPRSFLLNFDATFDFSSLVPESLHAMLMMFSDFGTPYGFRHMNAFGCHAFKMVNKEGKHCYVKFHFKPEAGLKNFTSDEAVEMCGVDPDFAKREMFDHITSGKEAIWTASLQVMTEEQANNLDFDPFDVTKVWDKHTYPLRPLGRLVLNRIPDNYHRDVEQAAFHPGSLVPGIELSPDALFQFRAFFYRDAQIHRLGVNLHQIPVNSPFRVPKAFCPFARDGALRADENGLDTPLYFPNSLGGARPDLAYAQKPIDLTLNRGKPKVESENLEGLVAKEKQKAAQPSEAVAKQEQKEISEVSLTQKVHLTDPSKPFIARQLQTLHEINPDGDYKQPRVLYREVMTPRDREHLHYNFAQALKFVQHRSVIKRFIAQLWRIDIKLAEGVLKELYKGEKTTRTGVPLMGLNPELTMKEIQEEAENGDVAKILQDRLLGYTRQGPLAHLDARREIQPEKTVAGEWPLPKDTRELMRDVGTKGKKEIERAAEPEAERPSWHGRPSQPQQQQQQRQQPQFWSSREREREGERPDVRPYERPFEREREREREKPYGYEQPPQYQQQAQQRSFDDRYQGYQGYESQRQEPQQQAPQRQRMERQERGVSGGGDWGLQRESDQPYREAELSQGYAQHRHRGDQSAPWPFSRWF